jgi:hypothetical protein
MSVPWIRKALVFSIAALGLQYLRVLAGRRPEPRPVPIPDGPLLIRGTPRVVPTALEPHGAL